MVLVASRDRLERIYHLWFDEKMGTCLQHMLSPSGDDNGRADSPSSHCVRCHAVTSEHTLCLPCLAYFKGLSALLGPSQKAEAGCPGGTVRYTEALRQSAAAKSEPAKV